MSVVSLTDRARVKAAGYIITKHGPRAWTLKDETGDHGHLMIGSYGCVSPTEWECFAEAIKRIEQDERLSTIAPNPAGIEFILASARDWAHSNHQKD
jgi:hypothetical protein